MHAKPSPGPTSPPGTFFRTLGAYDWAGVGLVLMASVVQSTGLVLAWFWWYLVALESNSIGPQCMPNPSPVPLHPLENSSAHFGPSAGLVLAWF